jgi:GT2 family glycosyltransferase
MDLTVVIRCGDDYRVFDCIDSIDEDVEIIVSTSENEKLEAKLRERGIKYVLSPRKNLSQTSNIGFNAAKFEKVFITDSDTLFEKTCLKQVYEALDTYKIARAKLRFKVESGIPWSRVVAEARDFVNSLPLVYTPGVGVRKEVINDIGGFLFDDPVPFAVDADLNFRVHQANVPVAFLKDACIYHVAEGKKHDFKAARRIGEGTAISTFVLEKRGYHVPINALKGVKRSHYGAILKTKGWKVLFYQMLWDWYYYRGHLTQKWFKNKKMQGDITSTKIS